MGVDEVIIYCVNDGAVMTAWAKDQGLGDNSGFITMMGDPYSTVTKALELSLTHAGPNGVGLVSRGKRAAMYLEDGEVKILRIAEGPTPKGEEDPAGDSYPDSTLAEAMIAAIGELHPFMKSEL